MRIPKALVIDRAATGIRDISAILARIEAAAEYAELLSTPAGGLAGATEGVPGSRIGSRTSRELCSLSTVRLYGISSIASRVDGLPGISPVAGGPLWATAVPMLDNRAITASPLAASNTRWIGGKPQPRGDMSLRT